MWFFLNKIRDNCDEIEILYAEIIYWARNAEWILNIEQWIWVFGVLCGIFGSVSNQHYMQSLSSMMLPSGGHNLRISSYRESKYYLLIVFDDVDVFAGFQPIFNWFKLFQATQIRSHLQMVFIFSNKNVLNVNLAGLLLILTCGHSSRFTESHQTQSECLRFARQIVNWMVFVKLIRRSFFSSFLQFLLISPNCRV